MIKEPVEDGIGENSAIALAKKWCLSVKEVDIWFSHLQTKQDHVTHEKAFEKARKQEPRTKESV